VVVEAVRRGLQKFRQELLRTKDLSDVDASLFSLDHLLPFFQEELRLQIEPRLRKVINATGVVLHTNLGRAPLSSSALEHLYEISKGYSNLEYDLDQGERGTRYAHVESTLCRLTGAEAAMVVNNNAGAVLLTLNTLAEGQEAIVSRGELVEIGGAFRIPDVMKRSGAVLKEVGTTNRTHLLDYEKAIGPQTALLLKVHTSNFQIMGFTSEVLPQDLVSLGKRHQIPVLHDLGSGCLIDLTRYGLSGEPTVQEVIKTGVDCVTFSGDKLLGGPQAGIILGKKDLIRLVKANPLTRALRIDKLTLASLESTLLLYLDEQKALEEIPILRMLTLNREHLRKRGRRLLRKLKGTVPEGGQATLREDVSQVGGGSLPLHELPTIVLAIKPAGITVNALEETLRKGEIPIISRINRDELILDMRTIFDEEIPLLAQSLHQALRNVNRR